MNPFLIQHGVIARDEVKAEIVATENGVVTDARRLLNITKAGGSNVVDCTGGNFTTADVGKRIRMFNTTTNQYVGHSTVTAINSTDQIVIADSLAGSITAGQSSVCWLGTDNYTVLQAILDAAGTKSKAVTLPGEFNIPQRLGVVRVSIPVTDSGTGCITTNTLVVPKGVELYAEAIVVSDCGDGLVYDREWVVHVKPGASVKRLVVDAMWGMGVKFGDAGAYSRSHVDILEIWNAGTDYNGALGDPSQVGALFTGYDWSVKDIWIKGGNIGLKLDSCSDFIANNTFLIGASNAIRGENSEQIQIKNVLLDTTGWVGVLMGSCSNVQMGIQAIVNTDGAPTATMSYGVMLGEYNDIYSRNKNIVIDYTAQVTGGTAVKISNTADAKIRVNLSNERLFTNSTGIKPIATGVQYGSGNFGALNVEISASDVLNSNADAGSAIMPFTGTRHGSLRINGMEVKDNLSLYRLNKDSNGVYVVTEYKRGDDTLFRRSTLSGGTSPQYTTRTDNFYNNDGTAVIYSMVYTLSYTDGELVSEVLQ